MSRWLLFTAFVVALAVPLDVSAQQQFPSTLAGCMRICRRKRFL
jgi:hypothetical protein